MAGPLDPFLPTPDVRKQVVLEVEAPAAVVMEVARGFDMQSVPLVRLIFALRDRIMGTTQARRPERGLVAETAALGWGVLVDEPDRRYVAGARCRPWEADVIFIAIPPAAFAGWNEPGWVKIAWTLETIPLGPGRTLLISETRAAATDEAARRRFRRYWRWARSGIIAIRWLLLPAIRRRAEAAWSATPRRS